MFKITISALIMTFMVVNVSASSPIKRQVTNLSELPNLSPNKEENENKNSTISSTCIKIESRCIFKIAATEKINLEARVKPIQLVIKDVINSKAFKNNEDIKVWQQGETNNIFIQIGEDRPIRLMNITREDAALAGVSLDRRAEQIIGELEESLELVQKQIQPDYLKEQGFKAISIAAIALLISLALINTKHHLKSVKKEAANLDLSSSERIEKQLTKSQKSNLR